MKLTQIDNAFFNAYFWKTLWKKHKLTLGLVLLFTALVFALDRKFHWFEETDMLGFAMTLANLLMLALLWFYQIAGRWRESLPLFETVVLEKEEGRPLVIVPYAPLSGMGDARPQAQSILQAFNENERLPLHPVLFAIEDQGVWQDETGEFNQGAPFRVILARLRLKKDADEALKFDQPSCDESLLHFIPSRALPNPPTSAPEPIPTRKARRWLETPQPVENQRSLPSSVKKCRRTLAVSRHPAAFEWIAKQGIPVDEKVVHLDLNRIQPGDCVIGNLPLHLIAALQARGGRYINLNLNVPPELRGKELNLKMFERCRPELMEYCVEPEEWKPDEGTPR